MAGRTETARAQIIIDGQQAETLLQQLGTRSKELKDELRRLKAEGKDFSGVQKELRQTESAMNSFKRATFDVSKVMQNLSKSTMKDLSRASTQLRGELKGMERGTQEYINKSKQLSVVRTELNKVQAEINGTAAAQQRANGSFGGGLKSMLAWTGGIYGVTSLMSSSVGEYMEAEKAQKKVAQAVKQTGMAAGFTSQELKAMAEEFQKNTVFDGDQIMNEVTAQLLSFPNIAGENFKLAQAAALDLATTLDGDLQSASIQLGKAMSDPVKGLTALRKSGVMFTEEQKEQVKVLVESGRLQEAQALILQEVNKQYGGQAVAAAQGAGGILQLKNMWGDLKEDLGEFLVNQGKGVVEWFKGAITWMRNNGTLLLQMIKLVASFAAGWMIFKSVSFVVKGFQGALVTLRSVTALFKKDVDGAGKATEKFGERIGKVKFAGLIGMLTTIIAVAKTLYDAFKNSAKAADSLGEINRRAAESMTEQKTKLESYLVIAKDANRSYDDRAKAVKALNELSPEYLGNLTVENINTAAGAKLIDEYVNALERKARAQAAQEILAEKNLEIIKLQNESSWDDLSKAQKLWYEGEALATRTRMSGQQYYESGSMMKIKKIKDEINGILNSIKQMSASDVVADGGGPKEGDTMQQGDSWYVFKGGKWEPMGSATTGGTSATKAVKEQKDAYEELNAKIAEYEKLLRAQITTGDEKQSQTARELANLKQQKQLIDDVFAATTDLSYRMEIKKPEEDINDFLKDGEAKPIATGLEDGLPQYASMIDKWWQGLDERVKDTFKNMEGYGKEFFNTLYSNKQDAWLESIKEETDADLANYKKLLDDKKITEDQYNAKVKAANARYEEAQKEAERKKALFSIALNTAVAVAKSIAMAPPLGLPMSAIAMAEGAAQAAIVMAQKAEGQYPVQGADDGKTYNATFAGPVRRTHIASRPTVYLAGETRLPELIVSGPHLRNLQMNYPEVLRAIYATRMTQHATGSYPAVSDAAAATQPDNSALMIAVIEKLMTKLDQPFKGYVLKSDIDQIQDNEDFISQRFAG